MTQVSEQPTQESPDASVYEAPGGPASIVEVKPRYENFIGGHWIAPVTGQYWRTRARPPASPSPRSPSRVPTTSSWPSMRPTPPRTPGERPR